MIDRWLLAIIFIIAPYFGRTKMILDNKDQPEVFNIPNGFPKPFLNSPDSKNVNYDAVYMYFMVPSEMAQDKIVNYQLKEFSNKVWDNFVEQELEEASVKAQKYAPEFNVVMARPITKMTDSIRMEDISQGTKLFRQLHGAEINNEKLHEDSLKRIENMFTPSISENSNKRQSDNNNPYKDHYPPWLQRSNQIPNSLVTGRTHFGPLTGNYNLVFPHKGYDIDDVYKRQSDNNNPYKDHYPPWLQRSNQIPNSLVTRQTHFDPWTSDYKPADSHKRFTSYKAFKGQFHEKNFNQDDYPSWQPGRIPNVNLITRRGNR